MLISHTKHATIAERVNKLMLSDQALQHSILPEVQLAMLVCAAWSVAELVSNF